LSNTSFTNDAVEEMSLPAAAKLTYEGLAPTYARTIIIEWTASWALTAAVIVGINIFTPVDTWRSELWWAYALAGLLFISGFVWAPMVARSRGFALRARDIHYKSGIIWRKTVSLPYNRIQHVELESGLLERLFKLSTLKFFTAGGGSADMKVPALTFTAASKIRDFVMEKAGTSEAEVGTDSVSSDPLDKAPDITPGKSSSEPLGKAHDIN